MHILLLLARVAGSDECDRTALDTDWLLSLAGHHDVTLAVDENSPACLVLRDAGVTVHVSDKRSVHLPGGGIVAADAALANWVTARHLEHPIDVVVASSERSAFGPVRHALAAVPWTVLATAGPTALTHRLGVDDGWLAEHGHELWLAASNLATADAALMSVRPELLDLEPGRAQIATLSPVPEPLLRQHATGELVVVVATSVSRADATTTMESALASIDAHPSMTIVVVHTPPIPDATDVAPALAASVPADLAQQVILVPTERAGEVGAWLDAADALVLADMSELATPAVARRAAVVPTVLARPTRGGPRTSKMLSAPPRIAPAQQRELLPFTRGGRVARELRGLRRQQDPAFVILHDEAATSEATDWLTMAALDRFDVVVGTTGRAPWPMPNLRRIDGGLVGLHRRTWNAVADELDRSTNAGLPGLIAHLADIGGARSHTLGAIVVQRSPDTVVVAATEHRPLDLASGPLPQLRPPLPRPQPPVPRATVPSPTPEAEPATAAPTPDAATKVTPEESLQTWARRARWPARARLALPWSMGLGDAVTSGEFPEGVARWARGHRITDRVRLLLPWKWGLLPRALEGRW